MIELERQAYPGNTLNIALHATTTRNPPSPGVPAPTYSHNPRRNEY